MDYNYNVAGSYNFNKDTFLALIDREGNILHESASGRRKIGVDNEVVNQMQEVIDNYYEKLCELGVFVKEKSVVEIAQEQAKEQAEINQALLQAINSLNNKVEELSTNGNARYDITEVSTNAGEKSAGSKASNSTSKKDDTKQSK